MKNHDAEALETAALAEEMFTSRWRLSSLHVVDPELYQRLMEQQALFDAAVFGMDAQETRTQAAAMVRGWKAAKARMEALETPDDAYQYGTDPVSGCVVAIGTKPPAGKSDVIFMTPDEVAKLVGAQSILAAAKEHFPDAELIDISTHHTAGEG